MNDKEFRVITANKFQHSYDANKYNVLQSTSTYPSLTVRILDRQTQKVVASIRNVTGIYFPERGTFKQILHERLVDNL